MKLKALSLIVCLATASVSSLAAAKTIYGLNEYAHLPEIGLELPAKLDTGAQTASLNAHGIKRFQRDGQPWVRFYLDSDTKNANPIEKPLARISRIKRRAGDISEDDDKTYTARPVVELQLCMGKVLRTIEVNLTDRSSFEYPLLIGSDALRDFSALVDPAQTYSAGKPSCPANLTSLN